MKYLFFIILTALFNIQNLHGSEERWVLKKNFESHITAMTRYDGTVYISLLNSKTTTQVSSILKSEDMGNTWDTIMVDIRYFFNLGIKSLSSPSEDFIYAQGKDFNIYKSSNKGVTWDTIKVDDGKSESKKIFFINENVGVASWVESSIYYTSDGGKNWNMIFNDDYPIAIHDVYIDNDMTIYFLLLTSDNGVTQSRLYYTHDFGASWNYSVVPICRNITILDKNNIYIATTEFDSSSGENITFSVIYYSSDLGKTWQTKLKQNFGFKLGTSKVVFFDLNHGIAVGAYGLIFRTTDGGDNWVREFFEPAYFHLHQIQTPISNILMISAHNAMLSHYGGLLFMPNKASSLISFESKNYLPYPNPSVNTVNLSGIDYIGDYRIYNTIGVLIDMGFSNNNQVTVSMLQPGQYFLYISSKSKFITFIKE